MNSRVRDGCINYRLLIARKYFAGEEVEQVFNGGNNIAHSYCCLGAFGGGPLLAYLVLRRGAKRVTTRMKR